MLLGDEEKEFFRRMMWRVAEFCGVEIVTYCVMTNHVHLLVRVLDSEEVPDAELCRRMVKYYGRREPWVQLVAEDFENRGVLGKDTRGRLLGQMGDVSQFMRALKQRFSKWYNKKHKRFGTLWAERFKSVLVEDTSESLRTVAMYIDLNPVRAGLVEDPKDYRFCGHAEAMAGNTAIRRSISWVCDSTNWRQASGEYRCLMMVYAGDAGRAGKKALSREQILKVVKQGGRLEPAEVLRLRIRYLTDGAVFGSKEFVNQVFEEFRDRFGKRRKTGARRLHGIGASLQGFAALRDVRKRGVE
ncbi:MAG: transposase [Limisphaerales bacterium]